MGNENSKSTTWSVRVPLWLDEELMKKKIDPEEKKSALALRALVAFAVSDTDAVEG